MAEHSIVYIIGEMPSPQHITTMDALRAGRPVKTYCGKLIEQGAVKTQKDASVCLVCSAMAKLHPFNLPTQHNQET